MTSTKSTVSVTKTVKGRLPSLPFEKIKKEILGAKYSLSVVFIGDSLSKKLNLKYRGKEKAANVLSFPLSKSEGEIFINPHRARQEAASFDMNTSKYLVFLLIHGLLHLKGFSHGSKMEKREGELKKKFGL